MREQGVLQSLTLVSGESMVLILDWRVSRCRSVWPERPKMVPPAQFRLQSREPVNGLTPSSNRSSIRTRIAVRSRHRNYPREVSWSSQPERAKKSKVKLTEINLI